MKKVASKSAPKAGKKKSVKDLPVASKAGGVKGGRKTDWKDW